MKRDIIIEKIEEEIKRLLGEMENVDVFSEDYEALVKRVDSLNNMINKQSEIEGDVFKNESDMLKTCKESEIKSKEIKHANLWNGVRSGIEIASIVAPLVFYGIWMNRGLEFEKDGSFTSMTFKGLLGKFKPTN